jgi:hypothetical protein
MKTIKRWDEQPPLICSRSFSALPEELSLNKRGFLPIDLP